MNFDIQQNERKNNFFNFFAIMISFLILFTFMQNYYSVIAHVVIFACCIIFGKIFDTKMVSVLLWGVSAALLLAFLARGREDTTPNGQLGFFLHYITWPIIYYLCIKNNSKEYNARILRIIIVMCIIGNIFSLKVLLENNEVSRIMAGPYEEYKTHYYALGVGGYGYVYAMVFLTYGAIVWLKNSKKLKDKLLLSAFLTTNYLFILYSSYTIAIIITLLLTFIALIAKKQMGRIYIFLFFLFFVILLFIKPIIEFGIEFSKSLELEWVTKRLSQFLSSETSGDYSQLKRYDLYMMSINQFFEHPFTGGQNIGGHSDVLDALGRFGIWGAVLPMVMFKYSKFCVKYSGQKNMKIFYIIFFVFAMINTADTMQIPIVIFFVVPLIISVFAKGNRSSYEDITD